MKRFLIFTSVALFIGLLSGCAGTPLVLENALPPTPFPELISHVDHYKGKSVVLGGYVLEVENLEGSTRIAAVQAPLGSGQRPKSKDLSKGRLVLIYNEFIDPEVYTKDRQITVGGTILDGAVNNPEKPFPYLQIQMSKIYLWPEEKQRTRDCFCHDPWFYYYRPWYWYYPW